MKKYCKLTIVEGFELIAGLFGVVHARQKRIDSRIVFAPKVVGETHLYGRHYGDLLLEVCSRSVMLLNVKYDGFRD